MSADAEFLGRIGPELELLLPELDEKARRLTLGMVARAAGKGGTGAVAKMTGASWQTVANGAAELGSGDVVAGGRGRRPGRGGGSAGRGRAARGWLRLIRGWCRRCWRWWRTRRGGIRSRRWRGRPRARSIWPVS